jgi:hypothetical protein
MAISTQRQRKSRSVRLASLGRPFHIVGEAARPANAIADALERLVAGDAELGLQVQVGGREEDVDAPALGAAERFAGQVDVPLHASGQRRDHGPTHFARDIDHRAEVGLRRCGKPASITSTPRMSSCRARRTLSSTLRLFPGACSPSLRVVSKIVIRRLMRVIPPVGGQGPNAEGAADQVVRGACIVASLSC